MFGSRRFSFSEHGRPFWLLVAIAVTLLVSVSTTISHAATASSLVQGLKRNVAAIRAQVERADPLEAGTDWRAVSFNAEPGDGGPAFRQASLATMMQAARRRGDQLLAGYQQATDDDRIPLAERLRLELQELQRQLDRHAAAPDRVAARVTQSRVEAQLDAVERTLGQLAPAPRRRS